MRKSFNDKCLNAEKFNKYTIGEEKGKTVIYPIPDSGKTSYCPFDNPAEIVLDYLYIGYVTDKGYDAKDTVFEFVKKYGFPLPSSKALNVYSFAEDAQMLYLHFAEASKTPYPSEPEFILETDPVSAVVKVDNGTKYIEWQTKSLSASIELAYTLLLCGKERTIGVCKHCGLPFYTKNPKAEFCSPPCRNKYNVYKSRAKNK